MARVSYFELVASQGDQIGRNFAIWAIFFGIGRIFFQKKSPIDLGEILAEKKITQNSLNKDKILVPKCLF
jgi:hypothetical protein